VHGATAPRVGLLTIGTEHGKGDRLRRAAAAAFARLTLPADGTYAGLVEGNDVVPAPARRRGDRRLHRERAAQGLETAYAARSGPRTPCRPRAAVLLGVAGTVVVCHGAADRRRPRRRHRPRRRPAPSRRRCGASPDLS
jgi:glycerol-3-phosphate acyltransferase PlsX